MAINLISTTIKKPEAVNLILGQTHFIKTVEDLHEALVTAVPGIKFGLAFCEASGPCLVRWSGTDPELIELARTNAETIGAGHRFLILLRDCFPINVLPTIRRYPRFATFTVLPPIRLRSSWPRLHKAEASWE